MKKLILSAVLGMFCYCTNNATEPQAEEPKQEGNKDIKNVLILMLKNQIQIKNAKEQIKAYGKKIYSQINEAGKVTKKKVLEFIIKLYTPEEQEKPKEQSEKKDILGDIEILEQYFHLKEKENEHDECSNENLTDIFWEQADVSPEKDNEEISKDGVGKIKEYFQAIIDAEKAISKAFQEYYDAKKKEKKGTQYEDILKEIIDECCGEAIGENLQTKFMQNLNNLCGNNNIENTSGATSAAIKRRIALSKEIKEGDFISFLKQKIGEEKKVVEQKILEIDVNPKEGCCHCC